MPTFSLLSRADESGRVRMVNGVARRSRMFWKEQGILGETSWKLSLKLSIRCGFLRPSPTCRSPSPTCSTSMPGPMTKWNGKARQNVLRLIRRSKGERDSCRAEEEDDDDDEEILSSLMKKDRHAGGVEVGGDGDEEGVEFADSSPSSLGVWSQVGFVSSTSTSDW